MHRQGPLRPTIVVLLSCVLAGCASTTTKVSPSAHADPERSATPTSNATASAVTSAPGATGQIFDTATIGPSFDLPMTIALSEDWRPISGDPKGALTLVHLGDPPDDTDQWWGPDIWLVDGATVHDPADIVSDQPASPDRSRFVAWPSDFFGYLASLPGVKVVRGPEPVTIGGIRGARIIVDTPPMHPIVWLMDDSAWMGGGPTGVDPASRRVIILLTVDGRTVFIGYVDAPTSFDTRLPLLDALLSSIEFGS